MEVIITWDSQTRVDMDVGCGMANFDTYLLLQNVLNMFIAQKYVHENQIQFAFELGILTMVTKFAIGQLLLSSQTFGLLHCLKYKINQTCDDNILLFETIGCVRWEDTQLGAHH